MNTWPGIEAAGSFDVFYRSFGDIAKFTFNNYPLIAVVWNIFLLGISCLLMFLMERVFRNYGFKTVYQKVRLFCLIFLWIIFFPNTAYIITDIRHIAGSCELNHYRACLEGVPVLSFFYLYSLIGVFSFIYFLEAMRRFLLKFLDVKKVAWFVNLLIPLSALGVLLGLIERWNSWQLFLAPQQILISVASYFTNSFKFFILLIFSLFLYILYYLGRYFLKNYSTVKSSKKSKK